MKGSEWHDIRVETRNLSRKEDGNSVIYGSAEDATWRNVDSIKWAERSHVLASLRSKAVIIVRILIGPNDFLRSGDIHVRRGNL